MRLTQLNPKWIGFSQWAASSPPYYIGMSFDSPTTGRRLAVLFWPPIDPENIGPLVANHKSGEKLYWDRTGDTFEALTLSPSINFENASDWHGFVTDGEIR